MRAIESDLVSQTEHQSLQRRQVAHFRRFLVADRDFGYYFPLTFVAATAKPQEEAWQTPLERLFPLAASKQTGPARKMQGNQIRNTKLPVSIDKSNKQPDNFNFLVALGGFLVRNFSRFK